MNMLDDSLLLKTVPMRLIASSLILALIISFLPFGRRLWMPDVVALALVFWSIHQPRRIGMGTAFVFGLIMDVQQAALLGQHALAYIILIYFAIMLHRRILWLPVLSQALQLLPLFLAARLITLLVRLLVGSGFPGWQVLLAPLIEAALWPVVCGLLLFFSQQGMRPDDELTP